MLYHFTGKKLYRLRSKWGRTRNPISLFFTWNGVGKVSAGIGGLRKKKVFTLQNRHLPSSSQQPTAAHILVICFAVLGDWAFKLEGISSFLFGSSGCGLGCVSPLGGIFTRVRNEICDSGSLTQLQNILPSS